MLTTLVTFNQGELEIRMLRNSETGEKIIFFGFLGESPRLELNEEELFFVYESLKDYFEKIKK